MNFKPLLFFLLSLAFFPDVYSQQSPEKLIDKFMMAMDRKDTAALTDCFFSNKGVLHQQAHVNLLLQRQRFLDLTEDVPLVGNTMFGITLYLAFWETQLMKEDPVIKTKNNKGTVQIKHKESGSTAKLNIIRKRDRWYFYLDHKGSAGIIAITTYFPELLDIMEEAVRDTETDDQFKERTKGIIARIDNLAKNPFPTVLTLLEEKNLSYYVTEELPGYSSSSITEVRKTDNFYNIIVAYGQGSTFESDLVVLDKKGQISDKLDILSEWGEAAGINTFSKKGEIKFLNDSLVEVRSKYFEEINEIEGELSGEFEITNTETEEKHYIDYYKVTDNGRIRVANWNHDWSTLGDLNKAQLRRQRNKVFAKHGYTFKSEDLQMYFSQYDWYEPRYKNVDDKLTEQDRDFVKYILELEKDKTE